MDVVHPDDLTKMMAEEKIHRPNRSSHTIEACYRSVDGTYRWHLLRAIPKISEHDEFKGRHGTSIDIHEYRLAQDEARRNSAAHRTG